MKRIILSLLLVILLSCPALSAPPTGIMLGLPDGAVNAPYSYELIASGTPPIIWQIAYGRLPSGLQLDSRTGVISGKPTAKGLFNFTVSAANGEGSTTKEFSINVPTEVIPPKITTATKSINNRIFTALNTDNFLTNVEVNQNFYYALIASGTEPIIWSISNGKLPNGLVLTWYGVITGIVDDSKVVTGRYTFTVKATNAAGSVTKTFDIDVRRP